MIAMHGAWLSSCGATSDWRGPSTWSGRMASLQKVSRRKGVVSFDLKLDRCHRLFEPPVPPPEGFGLGVPGNRESQSAHVRRFHASNVMQLPYLWCHMHRDRSTPWQQELSWSLW